MRHDAETRSTFRANITRSSASPLLALGVWYLLVVGLRFLLANLVADWVFMLLALASALAATGAMALLGMGRNGELELGPERIILDRRSVERNGLAVSLAVWRQAPLFTVLGSAVTLRDEKSSLVIGGRNHLVASRPDAASVQRVDASLSHDDFERLVALLGLRGPVAPRPGVEFSEGPAEPREPKLWPLTIDLVPSTVTLRGQWHTLGPFLGGMALIASISAIGGALGLFEGKNGMLAMQVFSVVSAVGMLVVMFRGVFRRPHVRYRLVLDPPRVLLSDERAGAGHVDASVARPEATPLVYHYSSRGTRYDCPALRLTWPSKTLVIGLWDGSLHWPRGTPRTRRLHYLVGRAEWEHLVRTLRL